MDRIVYTFSSDQTVSSGKFIGLGTQSGDFDDVALPSSTDGNFKKLVFSIKQNIGMGGMNIAPGPNESVDAYLVIVPYIDGMAGMTGMTGMTGIMGTIYGIPQVDSKSITDFLDNGNTGAVPSGTIVSSPVTLSMGKQCVIRSLNIPINECDIFGVYIRPNGFSSFKPAVTLLFGST